MAETSKKFPGEDTRFHPLNEEHTDSEGFPEIEDPNAGDTVAVSEVVAAKVAATLPVLSPEDRAAIQLAAHSLSPGAQPDEMGSDPRDGKYEI
jgi:hypothetical protein